MQQACGSFGCLQCNYYTTRPADFRKHLQTRKHDLPVQSLYACVQCREEYASLAEYKAHCVSARHFFAGSPVARAHSCASCGRQYANASGLWKHRKHCGSATVASAPSDASCSSSPSLESATLRELVKQNQELTAALVTISNKLASLSDPRTFTHVHVHEHKHTHHFNLNVFLNSSCKDAMNLADFVQSIDLQLGDLEHVGRVGYVEGLSSIIVQRLRDLDVRKRPLHCTDKKREVLYVRDNDMWAQHRDHAKVRTAVHHVAKLNRRLLPLYRQAHPHANYPRLVSETLGPASASAEDTIVKNIAHSVLLDKSDPVIRALGDSSSAV